MIILFTYVSWNIWNESFLTADKDMKVNMIFEVEWAT